MLNLLRQYRRRLAGTFGFLLAGAWLGLALAPCVAMAQAGMSDHGMAQSAETEHDCPHCDRVEASCANAVTADCGLPLALTSTDSERVKPIKFAALPVSPLVSPLPFARPDPPPFAVNVGPPHPPLTCLHCRFQE